MAPSIFRWLQWPRRALVLLGLVPLLLVLAALLFRRGADDVRVGLPAAQTKPVHAASEFSILTYNVQARPWLDDTREKLPKISPLLNGYDIVCIQECFQRHELLWEQAQQPNKIYFGRLSAGWKLANAGLSTLSATPLTGHGAVHYDDVGELQNMVACKGILLTRHVIHGMSVDVYNTHMEAGDTEAAHRARNGQARQMIAYVSENSPVEHSVIVIGDFNMGPRVPAHDEKDYGHYASERDMRQRTASFALMRDGLQLRDAFDDLFGPGRQDIERVLYRPGAKHKITPLSSVHLDTFRRADGSGLSDGAPLLTRLQIAPLD